MIVLDSSGWLEYLTDGDLADAYAPFIEDLEQVVTPTIVLYEVYKITKREHTEEEALVVAGQLMRTEVVPLTPYLALTAADLSLEHGLALADACVYATARAFGVDLVTSDADMDSLEAVRYLPKDG